MGQTAIANCFIHGLQVHIRDDGSVNGPMPLIMLYVACDSLRIGQAWAERFRLPRRVIRVVLTRSGLSGPHLQNDCLSSGGVVCEISFKTLG